MHLLRQVTQPVTSMLVKNQSYSSSVTKLHSVVLFLCVCVRVFSDCHVARQWHKVARLLPVAHPGRLGRTVQGPRGLKAMLLESMVLLS